MVDAKRPFHYLFFFKCMCLLTTADLSAGDDFDYLLHIKAEVTQLTV